MNMKKFAVLAYHSISDGLTPISIETGEFRKQMAYLKKRKYRVIGLNEYLEIIAGRKQISGKNVLITFDDAYRDVLLNALPVLKEMNYPAVISVNPFFVGKKAEFATRESDKQRAICSLEELNILSKNNFAVINHGLCHKNALNLSKEEAVSEYEKAKKWLEENIKINCFPNVFVFPKGSSDEETERVLKSRGAKIIFKKRIDVYPGKFLAYFALSLNPLFRWLRKQKSKLWF